VTIKIEVVIIFKNSVWMQSIEHCNEHQLLKINDPFFNNQALFPLGGVIYMDMIKQHHNIL